MDKDVFRNFVLDKGQQLYRAMPWRDQTDPYTILLSELMLQQTQVDRVIPKFHEFIERFPTITSLANATLSDVLYTWNGLGYNRRAKFLHDTAKKVVADFGGAIPPDVKDLESLPGIGPNTAGAIMVYSFNLPIVFIETNIRTVYLHHFFADEQNVDDKKIRTILEATLDLKNPRQFYWALMDYGAYLKKQGVGHLAQSKQYKKQPSLRGSIREVRGRIIRALKDSAMTEHELRLATDADERFETALQGLMKDGLVMTTKAILHLTK